MEKPTCRVEGCDRTSRYPKIRLCNPHYLRDRRFGDPLGSGAKPQQTTRERFDAKVIVRDTGCWEWSAGHFQATGYAILCMKCDDGKWRPKLAHRIGYEMYVGSIPDDLVIDHLCRNRGCVNPAHLQPVTHQDNVLRGFAPSAVSVRANRCHRGHEFTAENTYIKHRPNGRTKRDCRTCARLRDAKRQPRRR